MSFKFPLKLYGESAPSTPQEEVVPIKEPEPRRDLSELLGLSAESKERYEALPGSFKRRLENSYAILDRFVNGSKHEEGVDLVKQLEAFQDTEDMLLLVVFMDKVEKSLKRVLPDKKEDEIRRDCYREGVLRADKDSETLSSLPYQGLNNEREKKVESAIERRTTYIDLARNILRWFSIDTSSVVEKKTYNDILDIVGDGKGILEARQLTLDTLLNVLEVAEYIPENIAGFSPVIQNEIMKNAFAMELNEGCTVRCNFCAFEAGGPLKSTMAFKDLVSNLKRLNYRTCPFLYYASDPLDYRDDSTGVLRTYADVLVVYRAIFNSIPFTSTAYPPSAKDLISGVIDKIERLSISHMNIKRLKRDGFVDAIEGGDVVPIDGAFAEQMYFGSVGRIRELTTRWELHLNQIASFLYGNVNGNYNFLETQKTKQFYNAGDQRKRKKTDDVETAEEISETIACRYGVVVSPTRLRNSVPLPSSPKYPRGLADADLIPNNLVEGYQFILSLKKDLSEKKFFIDDILPHCVVNFHGEQDYIPRDGVGKGLFMFTAFSGDHPTTWNVEYDFLTGEIYKLNEMHLGPLK